MEGLSPIRFGSVSMVTATLGVNDPKVGDIVRTANSEYVFVYNNGSSQISKGFCATLTGVSGYSVTVSTVTGTDSIIGVCVHATLTTGLYGWLLKKGFCAFKASADSVVSAGGLLIPALDGTFTMTSTLSNTSSLNIYPVGKCMNATASAGTGVGYFTIY